MRVFLMCLLPTPCAPSKTNVRLWKVGSLTKEIFKYLKFKKEEFRQGIFFINLELSRLLRMSPNQVDRKLHCVLPNTCLGIAFSYD